VIRRFAVRHFAIQCFEIRRFVIQRFVAQSTKNYNPVYFEWLISLATELVEQQKNSNISGKKFKTLFSVLYI
jgi:hypothetical protein